MSSSRPPPPAGDPLSVWLEKRPRAVLLLVTLMLAYFAFNALIAARTHTPTDDEFVQLPMGLYYLKTGQFDLDRRNPPLMKMLSAAPLLLTDAKMDTDPQWRKKGEGWWMWIFGTRFMRINAAHFFDLFFWGRLANILLGLGGGFLVYLWARSWLGTGPALGTLFLYVTTPTLLGHSAVATLDMGLTFFVFAGFMALRRLAWCRCWPWALAAGSLFGCALATKFAALFFLPLIPILLALEWKPKNRQDYFELIRALALIALAGLFAINAAYLFKGFPLPDEMVDGIYFKSLERNAGRSLSYLLGLWSTSGWWYYYLVALFYKNTLPALLLFGAAIYGLLKVWQYRPAGWRATLEWFRPAFWLALPPIVLIEILSFHYQINFGIRYLLPAFPFLILIAGYGIRTLLRGNTTERRVLTALFAWQLLACTLASPHHLAYFNESAGGPYMARNILLDSNLDWGQDLGRLKTYMTENKIDRIELGYFGCVDPALYGIKYAIAPFEPKPGLYAISANYLSGLPPVLTYLEPSMIHSQLIYSPDGHWNWLDEFQPVARVGSSIYIFKIEPGDIRAMKK